MPRSKRMNRDAVTGVAGVTASRLYADGKLWCSRYGTWYARYNATDPWSTGHAAVAARDYLVGWALFYQGRQPDGPGVWEARELSNRRGRDYTFLLELRRAFMDLPRPEDLPTP